jgi:hypothetical protein
MTPTHKALSGQVIAAAGGLDEIKRLQLWLIVLGGGYVAASGAILAVASMAYILYLAAAFKQLRAGAAGAQPLQLADVAQAHPELFVYTAMLAGAGVVVGWVGLAVVKRVLGPPRRPPRRVGLTIAGMPAMLIAAAMIATVFAKPLVGALTLGPAVAVASWSLTPQLVAMAWFQLGIAARTLSSRLVVVEPAELTRDALRYFQSFDADATAAGLDHVADFHDEGSPGRCRRLWANPSHTVFASACWYPMKHGLISGFAAYTLTDDGAYLETCDVEPPGGVPEACRDEFTILAHADAEEVLAAHFRKVGQKLEADGAQPVQVAFEHQHQLQLYGMSRLMRAAREHSNHGQFLWLADPFIASPPMPPPGRPWNPAEEAKLAPPLALA